MIKQNNEFGQSKENLNKVIKENSNERPIVQEKAVYAVTCGTHALCSLYF